MIESKFARLISYITHRTGTELDEGAIIDIRNWVEECFYDEILEAKNSANKTDVSRMLRGLINLKYSNPDQSMLECLIKEIADVTVMSNREAEDILSNFKQKLCGLQPGPHFSFYRVLINLCA